MAFVIKHGMDAAPVVAASFGAGQADTRKKGAMAQAQAIERRGAREDQQQFRMDFADRAQERGREDFEYRFSAKQKAEQDKLRDAMDFIKRSDEWQGEDQDKALARVEADFYGIEKGPHEKEEFDFEKNIYADPVTKKRYYIDPKKGGRPHELEAERRDEISKELRAKGWADAQKSAMSKETGIVDPVKAKEIFESWLIAVGGDVQTHDGGGAGDMRQMIEPGVQAPTGPITGSYEGPAGKGKVTFQPQPQDPDLTMRDAT